MANPWYHAAADAYALMHRYRPAEASSRLLDDLEARGVTLTREVVILVKQPFTLTQLRNALRPKHVVTAKEAFAVQRTASSEVWGAITGDASGISSSCGSADLLSAGGYNTLRPAITPCVVPCAVVVLHAPASHQLC